MTTLKITIAYKGTHFNGWQYQPKGRTVQGVLEKTMSNALGENIKNSWCKSDRCGGSC